MTEYALDQDVEVNVTPRRGKIQPPAPEEWAPAKIVAAVEDDVYVVKITGGPRRRVTADKIRVPS